MSFLRALRAYIGLGPDEDIEDRYLYELNSRRRELDLEEIEAEEIYLDSAQEPVGLEIESDDVVIVTPGGGRTNIPRTGPRPSDARQGANRSGARRREAAGAGTRPASLYDISFEGAAFDDGSFDDGNHDGAAFDGGSVEGRGRGEGDGVNVITTAHRDAGENGRGADGDFDAEALLDFLEEEAFVDDPPAQPRVRGRGRTSQRDDSARAVVRSLDSMRAKPRTIIPESFGDAKLVADEFKRDIPVVLNLQSLDRDLARRLIDFASGICYAMDGSMEKIASQVFLLIPESVEVSDDDRRRIEERGYAR